MNKKLLKTLTGLAIVGTALGAAFAYIKKCKEVNHTDLTSKIIKVNNEEKNLEEWINLMISNSKDLILANIYSEENVKLAEFTIEIFKKTIFYL